MEGLGWILQIANLGRESKRNYGQGESEIHSDELGPAAGDRIIGEWKPYTFEEGLGGD